MNHHILGIEPGTLNKRESSWTVAVGVGCDTFLRLFYKPSAGPGHISATKAPPNNTKNTCKWCVTKARTPNRMERRCTNFFERHTQIIFKHNVYT